MGKVTIEFWERGRKVAECPASEVYSMDVDKQASFWAVQKDRRRVIKLRKEMEGDDHERETSIG